MDAAKKAVSRFDAEAVAVVSTALRAQLKCVDCYQQQQQQQQRGFGNTLRKTDKLDTLRVAND